jgi:hypothetical protein
MATAARVVYLLALIVWLGEVVCLSFFVAPTLFRNFAVEEAGRAVSVLFPVYYRVGAAAGVVLLLSALVLRILAPARAWSRVAVVVALMLAATLYAGWVVQPRAQTLRLQLHDTAASPALKQEFDRMHRLAVQLNGAVLIGGLAVAVITALRLKP